MKFYEVTKETWAWINSQLDYPASRQIKVHLTINEKYSLCGIDVQGGELGELPLNSTFGRLSEDCKRCAKSRLLKKAI